MTSQEYEQKALQLYQQTLEPSCPVTAVERYLARAQVFATLSVAAALREQKPQDPEPNVRTQLGPDKQPW